MKIRHDNYMSDCIDAVYVKNETKLAWSIGSSLVCDEIRQDNDVIDYTRVVHIENENELSWPIKPGAIYDENQT